MMKKGLMLAVFALISLIYAGETPQKIPVGSGVDKALVYDFNEAVKMTPYPAQAAKSFSLDCPSYSPESGKALKIEKMVLMVLCLKNSLEVYYLSLISLRYSKASACIAECR